MAKAPEKKWTPAIKVSQWLAAWNEVEFDEKRHRARPKPFFYILTLPAAELRSLCGIFCRSATGVRPRGADLGIQRQHDRERSDEIRRFVKHGYPWSTLSESKRRSRRFDDLQKPGWLPTAVVVNILEKKDRREGQEVDNDDLVVVRDAETSPMIGLPYSKWSNAWKPSLVPPLEVIDGQHRLWAFDSESELDDFYVPIVAFHGLDISWQAYLFWTINIKPKRINASLAFDLYPLLRAEDWLERAEEHVVYRDTRSQELTEALWSHEQSPWFDKINMLGEPKSPWVTQAAWIRSLSASFVKPWEGRRRASGGLFGARIGESGEVLSWNRAQQAAFLIFAWSSLRQSIRKSRDHWATMLRAERGQRSLLPTAPNLDKAFYGPHTLVATDQGVRGFLQVINDLCYYRAAQLKLNEWTMKADPGRLQDDAISEALKSLEKQPVAQFVVQAAECLSSFDWRTSTEPSLTETERSQRLVFRGGSGYRELRRQLIAHIGQSQNDAGEAARRLRVATKALTT